MNRSIATRLSLAFAGALLGLAVLAASSSAEPLADYACPQANFGPADQFGICNFDGQLDAGPAPESPPNSGDPSDPANYAPTYTQAAGAPYDLATEINFNTRKKNVLGFYDTPFSVEPAKDVLTDVPAGLLANPTVVSPCSEEQLVFREVDFVFGPTCPASSQVGTIDVLFDGTGSAVFPEAGIPLFNMVPPPGVPARFGFNILHIPVVLDARLRNDGDYGFSVDSHSISEGLSLNGVKLTFWGVPAASSHDAERACPGEKNPTQGGPSCPAGTAPAPFLRVPTNCTAAGQGLPWVAHADSWWHPASYNAHSSPDLSDPNWHSANYESHLRPGLPDDADPEGFPGLFPSEGWGEPKGIEGCDIVPANGQIGAQLTAQDTETPTGLNVSLDVNNPGLENPQALVSTSDIRKAVVTLPEGVTINPSQADGLGVCTPGEYATEEASFHPDPSKGCPSDSKIGTVEVKTPLLDETLQGEVFIAAPHDNPFDSLLALYVVIKSPERGILVKLPGEVETDPVTGQITTTFDDLPQLPFSHFSFRFREGARAPLVTPPACGDYTTEAKLTPWSDSSRTIVSTSTFAITHGIGDSPCPSGGLPPFRPGLIAGSLNNNAGSYSPFDLRLFRTDSEQEITHFSIKLPPGLIGKLAGLSYCPDAALEAAKLRTGASELASPSCPATSEVGHTLVGAGVGSVLTYAPGKIYLAGPYHGSNLSIAAITAAKVGPFDLGTVVVRQALRIDPETAEVFIDATGSDPIPHIIDGITTHLRDIRAYVDRPEFTLNPTNCDPTSTASTVLGSGLDFASEADDRPVTVSTRYQAANCANLPFRPKLALSLKGGTKRGDTPALKAVLSARKGDANIGAAQVTLPHSEFLEQAHIKTICTRAQFKEGTVPGEKCPAASIYGHARAITPLLDEPLQGPVYLRSSSHNLPDLLAALHSGKIDIDLDGHIDSVKGGRIRNTFEAVPDAPVTRFTLEMQGGKKGLLVNSTDLCKAGHRAISHFVGQNGKVYDTKPVLKAKCGGKAKKGKGGKKDKRHR